MARSTFSLQKSFLLFIFNAWQKLAEQVILTDQTEKLFEVLHGQHDSWLAKNPSKVVWACLCWNWGLLYRAGWKDLNYYVSIFLIAGVEKATNSARLILAQDSFARLAIFGFKQETQGFQLILKRSLNEAH